jgi:hypothetical protein
MNMHSPRQLQRAACHIHAAFQAEIAPQDFAATLRPLKLTVGAMRRAYRTLAKAENHGLSLILPRLRSDVLIRLQAIVMIAGQAHSTLDRSAEEPPSASMLLAELLQLDSEFDGLRIDWKEFMLAVTTEPITLEHVELGRFEIQLHWERLAHLEGNDCFEIVALDPNPAQKNDSVTHPHVQSGSLCAGEAKRPLRAALAQGRLTDAFCLIRSVLRTYNAESPHVRLEDWAGEDCYDCGYSIGEDGSYYCPVCGHDYCEECSTCCAVCDQSNCRDCLGPCAVCEESCCKGCLRNSARSERACCRSCLEPCAICGANVAKDELTEEGRHCSVCRPLPPTPEDCLVQVPRVPTTNPLPTENADESIALAGVP